MAGQRVPAGDGRSVGPSWDLDKQPFVFVDAFVSQCGDLPTASTWTDGLTDRCYFLLIYSQRRRADSYHFYAPFILPSVVNRNEEKQSYTGPVDPNATSQEYTETYGAISDSYVIAVPTV